MHSNFPANFFLKASLCVIKPFEVSSINNVLPKDMFSSFSELYLTEKCFVEVLISLIFLKKVTFLKKNGDNFINFLDLDITKNEFK